MLVQAVAANSDTADTAKSAKTRHTNVVFITSRYNIDRYNTKRMVFEKEL